MNSFFSEMKRRNVFRVGAVYLVTIWLLVQVADQLLGIFDAPTWIMRGFVIFGAIGFPIALILAWLYDFTSAGIKREGTERAEEERPRYRRSIDFAIVSILVIALAFFLVDRFVFQKIDSTFLGIPSANSIGVLPFANRSSVVEDAYFVEGMHDDLLTALARIGGIKVISRTSMMQYKNTTKSTREIAEELGVRTILEGGIQRSGDQIRINMQLIDAFENAHLWADTFDRQLTTESVFVIQTEITEAVLTALEATVTQDEQRMISRIPTDNLEAYNAVVQGNLRLERRTISEMERAKEFFQQAVELDPNYSEAWAQLGLSYVLLRNFGSEQQNLLRDARAAIDESLRLNELDGGTWVIVGDLERASGNRPAASRAYQRAIDFSPGKAETHASYSTVVFEEDPQKGLALIERAIELDPLNNMHYLDRGIFAARLLRYDEAVEYFNRSIELELDYALVFGNMAVLMRVQGKLAEAYHWHEKEHFLDPSGIIPHLDLIITALSMGEEQMAQQSLDQLLAIAPDNPRTLELRMRLALREGDLRTARNIVDMLPATETGRVSANYLEVLRDVDIESGNPAAAVERYREFRPEYFAQDFSQRERYGRRISLSPLRLAFVLKMTGEDEFADRLLNDALDWILELSQTIPPDGSDLLSIARIKVMLGRTAEALQILDTIPDAGWPMSWQDDVVAREFDAVRDTPKFRSMVNRLTAHGAAELERHLATRDETPSDP